METLYSNVFNAPSMWLMFFMGLLLGAYFNSMFNGDDNDDYP